MRPQANHLSTTLIYKYRIGSVILQALFQVWGIQVNLPHLYFNFFLSKKMPL
jgi:hypothetical protein